MHNIMLTDKKETGRSGMLIDLDLAVSVDKHGRNEQTGAARTMTGTLEYMAIEILEDGLNPKTAGIEHTYRHDLESFFYVLLSACIRYGWEDGNSPKINPLKAWYTGSIKNIYLAKSGAMIGSAFEGNVRFQKRWWSRLSENKANRLRQLFNHIDLSVGFDALLPIPGLWDAMRIGVLPRVMALKCDEEILHYLGYVKEFWASLVNNDRAAMARIDRTIVEALQLMAPGASSHDAKIVHGLVLSGQVFGDFSEQERAQIWETLRSFDGLVPSLYSFFEDFKYLESCAHCVKRLLVRSKSHPTVRATVEHMFTHDDQINEECFIQTSEFDFRRMPGSRAERLDFGYRQVWLYAMRHYPDMAKDSNCDDLLAKPAHETANENVVYEMGALAHQLGFRSPPITELTKQSPDLKKSRFQSRHHIWKS